ncbi:Putative exported protein, partial [Salmonella enterica subsp. enterica serovar Inverness str. R8-3668]
VTRDETLSDAVIETVLPDFYVYPGKSISYTILTQGHRGFMFTIGKRPIFFCTH